MNPSVASSNLYSLNITVTYETSQTKATYDDVIVGHSYEDNIIVHLLFLSFFSFLIDIIQCLIILIAFDMRAFIPRLARFITSQRLNPGPVLPEQAIHSDLNTSNNGFTHSGFDPFV